MSRLLTHYRSRWLGYGVLALWLVWTVATLVSMARPAQGDAAQLQQALRILADNGQLPTTGKPVALQLRTSQCPCGSLASPHWNTLRTQLAQRGGEVRTVDWPHSLSEAPEVVLLAADHRVLYTGPVQLPAALCGHLNAGLERWVPALLEEQRAPVLLAPTCSC
jgi:hypothetical protein